MDEARELRLELMEERSVFGRDHDEAFDSVGLIFASIDFLCFEDLAFSIHDGCISPELCGLLDNRFADI